MRFRVRWPSATPLLVGLASIALRAQAPAPASPAPGTLHVTSYADDGREERCKVAAGEERRVADGEDDGKQAAYDPRCQNRRQAAERKDPYSPKLRTVERERPPTIESLGCAH